MFKNDPVEIHLDVVGSITGERYVGIFKVRPLLSMQGRLKLDELRRQYLGIQSTESVSDDAANIAFMTAKIAVHVTESPAWWTNQGLNVIDTEPMSELFDKIFELEKSKTKKVESDGDKAAEVVKEKMP